MTIIFVSIFWLLATVSIYYFFEYKNSQRLIAPFVLTLTAIGIATTHIFFLSISNKYSLYTGQGKLDMSTTGQVGDFFGGVVGTIAGGISIILLFKTLKVQIDFNQKQKEDLATERFENKFYELLKMHRDNVDQVSIHNLTGINISGRKTFSRLFNELRFIYYYCVNNIEEQKKSNSDIKLSDEKIYNIAYLIFFFGTGEVSNKLVQDILDKDSTLIFKSLTDNIKVAQYHHRNDDKRETLKTLTSDGKEVSFYYDYVPFQGHMGNLSHYVRHIFQLVKFVEDHYPLPKDTKAKNNYITTIRSQLSTYEQAFLYYNALSVLGKPWLESEQSKDGLLKKYSIIKSLPKPLADFYRTPDEIFGISEKDEDDNILFEWTKIKRRYNDIDKKEKVS